MNHEKKCPLPPCNLQCLTLRLAWLTCSAFWALLSGVPRFYVCQPQWDQLELFCHKPVLEESQRARTLP